MEQHSLEMSSSVYLDASNSRCRVCLAVAVRMHCIRSTRLLEVFEKLTSKKLNADGRPHTICYICYSQLQRCCRFSDMCHKSEQIQREHLLHGTEEIQPITHNLTVTTLQCINYSNEADNTPPLIKQAEVETDSFFISSVDDHDDDSTEINNDDLPLILLSKNGKKTKRKKSRRDLVCGREMKSESNGNVPNGSSKRVKELKEGFSSRMVQETDEYVVIKLTREQVLQEMKERSETEVYIQSPFKCELCVKGFNFQDVLRTHMNKHVMENGAFQCDMCSQYCRSAVSLRGHIKSHTTRYKCKLCGVVRLSRQHLLEHHAITHTRQAVTYSCDTCQFNTNKRTVMQRHVKSHTSAEPHACEQCGKLFKSIDSLRVHTMRHDKSSRLRCSQCDVSFVYVSLLRRHVARVHERREYYCVECDAHFKSNESLRLHFKKAKRHRDSSTYKHACTQCSMRFFSPAALSVHLCGAHAAPRTHACAACRRRYCSRDALRAHVHRVHNKQTIQYK